MTIEQVLIGKYSKLLVDRVAYSLFVAFFFWNIMLVGNILYRVESKIDATVLGTANLENQVKKYGDGVQATSKKSNVIQIDDVTASVITVLWNTALIFQNLSSMFQTSVFLRYSVLEAM